MGRRALAKPGDIIPIPAPGTFLTKEEIERTNRDTGMQDGILRYYNEATQLTDWYADKQIDTTHFNCLDMLKPKKK